MITKRTGLRVPSIVGTTPIVSRFGHYLCSPTIIDRVIFSAAAVNRFAGTRLEDLQGQIAHLCKDQHGCRYLQKKLEEGQADHRDMIFRETFSHFAELMIGMWTHTFTTRRITQSPSDPFGNYLCQKLLEYSTDEQRNMICESVAQDLVSISLNMHGTRAVQKMIDFLTTQRQVSLCREIHIPPFPIRLRRGVSRLI